MSIHPPDRQRLGRLLHEEHGLLGDFVALLAREEKLLLDGEIDALLELAEQKTSLYRRLQFMSDERSRIFSAARLEHDAASMRKALAGDQAAQTLWSEVVERAREARERNQRNGHLITERMQHNQQALAVLMAAASQPGATYGPDGQARPHLTGRRLGSV